MRITGNLGKFIFKDLQTYPKSMQYNAATIGIGIDAKIAPNFPKNIIRNRYMNNEKEKIESTLYETVRFPYLQTTSLLTTNFRSKRHR